MRVRNQDFEIVEGKGLHKNQLFRYQQQQKITTPLITKLKGLTKPTITATAPTPTITTTKKQQSPKQLQQAPRTAS